MNKAICTVLTALSLVAAPTMAAAAPISTPLTQPATETVDGDNALAGLGGGGSFIVLALAVVFIGLGIYVAVDKNDDQPDSP